MAVLLLSPLIPDMALSLELTSQIEDTLNRLAAESMLAQVGKDEGLIPSYSLLAELAEQTSTQPELNDPPKRVRDYLEKRLDSAQPFDDTGLRALRGLVEWFTKALVLLRQEHVPAHFDLLHSDDDELAAPTSASAVSATAAAEAPTEELLDLHLEENRELLVEFRAEAVEHLAQIEAALLTLDGAPEDKDALNSIFRSFHTIKGVSGFLQLKPMHVLTHEVESLLDLARNLKLRLNPTIITAILQSRDAVSVMVDQMSLALDKGQLPTEIVPVSHLIREVKLLSVETPRSAQEAPVAKLPPSPAPAPAPAPVPVPAPVVVESKPAVPQPPPAPVEVKPAPAKPAPTDRSASAANAANAGNSGTVRVNTEKLDNLMDVVGELVIVQSQIVESARTEGEEGSALQRNVSQLGRITKDLQRTAMSLRMVPVKPTFQKMERLARDLARDFGKKVVFVSAGDDTEVDRTVVEDIGDPLVHMVRNSLDHGLESPADRVAAGKSETGRLELKAYHQGSNIIIELSDDGKGIDPQRILAKALKLNLASSTQHYSKEEILSFIFLPGFSTAEKVTAVSGRGVGMDVVRRNIEKLRGKVEIDSEVGRGTIFRIKLPLTMAIIDGLVVRVGGDRFIIPSTSVQMALRPEKGALTMIHGRGEVLDHRGRILPLHRLHRRFDIPGAIEHPWEGIVVIIESNDRVVALLVDDMVSKQEVVIKNLGGFLHGLAGVAGGAILGDGNIALILDPASLLEPAA
jgi:two-component system chemotaxis sensor kinase CheA